MESCTLISFGNLTLVRFFPRTVAHERLPFHSLYFSCPTELFISFGLLLQVIKMLIIVVIVFGLCWLPLQLYNILYVTFPEVNEYQFIGIVWFSCDWLAMSNSCYNPFIYGIYNVSYKLCYINMYIMLNYILVPLAG